MNACCRFMCFLIISGLVFGLLVVVLLVLSFELLIPDRLWLGLVLVCLICGLIVAIVC